MFVCARPYMRHDREQTCTMNVRMHVCMRVYIIYNIMCLCLSAACALCGSDISDSLYMLYMLCASFSSHLPFKFAGYGTLGKLKTRRASPASTDSTTKLGRCRSKRCWTVSLSEDPPRGLGSDFGSRAKSFRRLSQEDMSTVTSWATQVDKGANPNLQVTCAFHYTGSGGRILAVSLSLEQLHDICTRQTS